MSTTSEGGSRTIAFDTDRDGNADYWEYPGAGGRIEAIAYADGTADEPGPRIELDRIDPAACPHFLIALDGVPFEVVARMHAAGRLPLFHPPTRVISCFPSMTDLALAELFHAGPCLSLQARTFDRVANRVTAGNSAYLSAANAPWAQHVAYRGSPLWDALVYLKPAVVFQRELRGTYATLERIENGTAAAYLVGPAGLGTRGGAAAIEKYLDEVEQLCERIIFERRGHVKLTLTADHGHNLVENRRITLEEQLKRGGYRLTSSLRRARDVVVIEYGLVTYAELFTQDPAGAATCLVAHPDVEFAVWPSDDALLVRDRNGEARIRRGLHGFTYEMGTADPLHLQLVLERLRAAGRVAADGEIDPEALLAATIDHEYPDPLARLWQCFHGLVHNRPDLLVNLRDGACHGSSFFRTMVGKVASTHGSLNARNSNTFVLTMLDGLPPTLRIHDVLPALQQARETHPLTPAVAAEH